MTATNLRNPVAWFAMVVIGLAWGVTIPLTKIAVSTGHQPFGLIFWQLVIAILVLGGVLLARGKRPPVSQKLAIFYLVVALTGTLLPNSTSYLAQQHLPAGVMAIAIATVPMFTLFMALSLRIEPPSLIRLAGILTGFVAMVLIAVPDTSLPEPEKAVFVLVALIAPFFYGIESIFVSMRRPENADPVSILFMASVFGLCIALPLAIATGQWINPLNPWLAAEWALIGSSVIHALTYCAFIWLIGFAGPVFSDQAAYPVTLSGVFFSILFLGESYSGWIWTALVLVIAGLVLVQPKFREPETELRHD